VKAALLVEPGRIVIDDVAEPAIGPDDVRIRVGGVGLCGSDLSLFRGTWQAPRFPWIQGHEAFGSIEAVGDRVSAARVGEVVVVEPNVVCGQCAQCLLGRTSACLNRQSVGMNRPGALAERLVVPSEFAWRVGPADPRHLVCIEPLTVVEAALRRLSTPIPGAVLVIGAGAQGLLMCLALERRGVRAHAVDVNAGRVEHALSLGAHEVDMTDPSGRFDLVVDTAGTPESIEVALGRTEIGGTILVLGLESRPFELSAQTLVRRQLVLRGSLTYDHPADFRASTAMLDEGVVSPGRVVTDEFSLDDAQRAFDSCAASPGKTWICVDPRYAGGGVPGATVDTAARRPSR
jgi:alcohol dehydrogenase/L-iditol 2-dehydrogenase